MFYSESKSIRADKKCWGNVLEKLKLTQNNAFKRQIYFSLISNEEEALEKRHSSTLSSLLITKRESVSLQRRHLTSCVCVCVCT